MSRNIYVQKEFSLRCNWIIVEIKPIPILKCWQIGTAPTIGRYGIRTEFIAKYVTVHSTTFYIHISEVLFPTSKNWIFEVLHFTANLGTPRLYFPILHPINSVILENTVSSGTLFRSNSFTKASCGWGHPSFNIGVGGYCFVRIMHQIFGFPLQL